MSNLEEDEKFRGPYPDVRVGTPPAFLIERYKTTEAFLSEVAKRTKSADILDIGTLASLFDCFDKLFYANFGQLKEAVALCLPQLPPEAREPLIETIACNIQRLLIFRDVDEVIAVIKSKFMDVARSFPRSLMELEEAGGGRDLLDPFIVALNARLLSSTTLEDLLRNLVAHKCLMKLEDLIGHLHEEVLGRAAGKQRVDEPKGIQNKEKFDPILNPYPGADARLEQVEFYQIKNKTGSAKGGDGKRLGEQLRQLGQNYPGSKRFYVAMIGRSLKGHRSMGAVIREDPEAEVLVGLAAFQQLGTHRDTPSIVLDLYLEQFTAVESEIHYDINEIVHSMANQWRDKHGDGEPAYNLLRDMIVSKDPDEQQSSKYISKRLKKAPPGTDPASLL